MSSSMPTAAVAATQHLANRLQSIEIGSTVDGLWETADEAAIRVLLSALGVPLDSVKPPVTPVTPTPVVPSPTAPPTPAKRQRHSICGSVLTTASKGLYCPNCGIYVKQLEVAVF